jgi:hypothetical protein
MGVERIQHAKDLGGVHATKGTAPVAVARAGRQSRDRRRRAERGPFKELMLGSR